MEEVRLHGGELNVMELLWSNQVLPARDIAKIIKKYVGWEKNTTYTVIKRLIEKGCIKRVEPGFLCYPIISKRAVQKNETRALLNQFFDGSLNNFLIEYLDHQPLTKTEIMELQRIIASHGR